MTDNPFLALENRPVQPQEIQTMMQLDTELEVMFPLTPGHKGALTGALNHFCGHDANRKMVLGWFFSPEEPFMPLSSKELTEWQWILIANWIGSYQDEATGKWHPNWAFPTEALWCAQAAWSAFHRLHGTAAQDMADILRKAGYDIPTAARPAKEILKELGFDG